MNRLMKQAVLEEEEKNPFERENVCFRYIFFQLKFSIHYRAAKCLGVDGKIPNGISFNYHLKIIFSNYFLGKYFQLSLRYLCWD